MGPYVDALDRIVDKALWRDAGRRFVVAHSFGGMLALSWWLHHAGAYPATVDGLVLIGTTAGPMFESVRARVLKVGSHELRVGISSLMWLWNARAVTRAVDALFSGGRQRAVDFQALPNPTDLSTGLLGWRATHWKARRSFRNAMRGFDARAALSKIDVPTIVLHGTDDHLFAVDRAEELARGLPNGELRVIPSAAHVLPLTHGAEVVRAVHDLVDGA